MVKNNIKINEKAYTDNNNEIKIGTLKNKQVAKVEFKVNVDDKKLTKIENQISLEYGYYMQADSKIQETKTSEKILTNYSEKCESNLPPIAGDDSKELKENTSITITPDISDPEVKLDLKSLSIVGLVTKLNIKIQNTVVSLYDDSLFNEFSLKRMNFRKHLNRFMFISKGI